MRFLFCGDPLRPRVPDDAYSQEHAAAQAAGAVCSLIDFEALVDQNDAELAVRMVAVPSEETRAIYRGWMLKPERYQALYDALQDRGITLITSPQSYTHCHYLPRWYSHLSECTPRTVWTETGNPMDIATLMELLRTFGDRPIVVKDWVKSCKHEWLEACFIPSAQDRHAVERVVSRFLELQGDDLNVGLVFREFVEFERAGADGRGGMPSTKEVRIFFFEDDLIQVSRYWDEGSYAIGDIPIDHFKELARRVESPFFTMDVARTDAGDWLVIELGDGQVSQLPADVVADGFYARLAGRV